MIMKLADYLRVEDIDQAAFAKLIETTQVAVSRYATGKRIPRPEIMRRIATATDGKVTPPDFYDVSSKAA